LISEYTRGKIGDEFLLRRLDRVRVVGINTPLRLYEVLGISSEHLENSNEQMAVKIWEQGIDLFEGRDFGQALNLFKSVKQIQKDDLVADLYIERCKDYMKEPPPADWDAVRNLTEK